MKLSPQPRHVIPPARQPAAGAPAVPQASPRGMRRSSEFPSAPSNSSPASSQLASPGSSARWAPARLPARPTGVGPSGSGTPQIPAELAFQGRGGSWLMAQEEEFFRSLLHDPYLQSAIADFEAKQATTAADDWRFLAADSSGLDEVSTGEGQPRSKAPAPAAEWVDRPLFQSGATGWDTGGASKKRSGSGPIQPPQGKRHASQSLEHLGGQTANVQARPEGFSEEGSVNKRKSAGRTLGPAEDLSQFGPVFKELRNASFTVDDLRRIAQKGGYSAFKAVHSMHAELMKSPFDLTRAQVVAMASRPGGDQALLKFRSDVSTLCNPAQTELTSGMLSHDGRWEVRRL